MKLQPLEPAPSRDYYLGEKVRAGNGWKYPVKRFFVAIFIFVFVSPQFFAQVSQAQEHSNQTDPEVWGQSLVYIQDGDIWILREPGMPPEKLLHLALEIVKIEVVQGNIFILACYESECRVYEWDQTKGMIKINLQISVVNLEVSVNSENMTLTPDLAGVFNSDIEHKKLFVSVVGKYGEFILTVEKMPSGQWRFEGAPWGMSSDVIQLVVKDNQLLTHEVPDGFALDTPPYTPYKGSHGVDYSLVHQKLLGFCPAEARSAVLGCWDETVLLMNADNLVENPINVEKWIEWQTENNLFYVFQVCAPSGCRMMFYNASGPVLSFYFLP